MMCSFFFWILLSIHRQDLSVSIRTITETAEWIRIELIEHFHKKKSERKWPTDIHHYYYYYCHFGISLMCV